MKIRNVVPTGGSGPCELRFVIKLNQIERFDPVLPLAIEVPHHNILGNFHHVLHSRGSTKENPPLRSPKKEGFPGGLQTETLQATPRTSPTFRSGGLFVGRTPS